MGGSPPLLSYPLPRRDWLERMDNPQQEETFELEVNGVARRLRCAPDAPLLYVLRRDLGLSGPRFGCGMGACGACFVLLDGRPVSSCDLPVWSAAGKKITTVEGLGTAQRPHPLQRAFLDEQAAQCGYCVSGILISAAALLASTSDPSEDDVKAALDRNLCRCGSQQRMVRAVLRAAKEV